MAVNITSIEWTDRSVNPIRARRIDNKNRVPGHFCTKKSSGCANCYSSRMQVRFGMPGFPGISKTPADMGIEVYLDDNVLKTVLALRKPSRIFWCDMTDMLGEWVPDNWIDKCFAVMGLTPQHTHQVLTKRAGRMAQYLTSAETMLRVFGSMGEIVAGTPQERLMDDPAEWPLSNVWLGTSCENQETADERIPHLRQTPAAVRFVSAEPLLGPVTLNLDGIAWVICGGESGQGARPMHQDWARSLRDQCAVADVPFFI
ncbi:MAG TPA: phage Gp37/Gp68 family protein, partial [Bryobacteraceae bacterium]|nr:phage Gp37/Gp68 family protein [Bryobacteraceae bacterium]